MDGIQQAAEQVDKMLSITPYPPKPTAFHQIAFIPGMDYVGVSTCGGKYIYQYYRYE